VMLPFTHDSIMALDKSCKATCCTNAVKSTLGCSESSGVAIPALTQATAEQTEFTLHSDSALGSSICNLCIESSGGSMETTA